jgi:hypothetical protein
MPRVRRKAQQETEASGWISGDATIQLVFAVEGRRYCVSVDDVSEIYEFDALRRVPAAPAEVAGIIDLRGRIVTLLNVFGTAAEGWKTALVFQKPHRHLGLRVPLDLGIAFRRRGEAVSPLEEGEPWLEGLWEQGGNLYHVLSGRRLAGFARARVVERFKQ